MIYSMYQVCVKTIKSQMGWVTGFQKYLSLCLKSWFLHIVCHCFQMEASDLKERILVGRNGVPTYSFGQGNELTK